MNLQEYRKRLEKDPAVIKAENKLKPYLDLADEVLRLRMERGWSQEELARRVGTRQSNISKLESGMANPTYKFLVKLAEAFGTELSVHLQEQKDPEFVTILPVVLQQAPRQWPFSTPRWGKARRSHRDFELAR